MSADLWAKGWQEAKGNQPAPFDEAEFAGWQAARVGKPLGDNPFAGGPPQPTLVTFFSSPDGGNDLTLGPGSLPSLTGLGWNDRIRALRIGAADPQQVSVTLYEHDNYKGAQAPFFGAGRQSVTGPLAGQASSIEIGTRNAAPGTPPQAPPAQGSGQGAPPPAPVYLPGQAPPPVYTATSLHDLWEVGRQAGVAGRDAVRTERAYLDGYAAGLRGDGAGKNPYPPTVVGQGNGPVVGPPPPAGDPSWQRPGSVQIGPGRPPVALPPGPLYRPEPMVLPVLNPALTYEVYATVPTLGGVPLDVAIVAGIPMPGAQFYLLGNDAADWRCGFGLSGPNGPGPEVGAQRFGPNAKPLDGGLAAWVVAQRVNGVVALISGDWFKRTFRMRNGR